MSPSCSAGSVSGRAAARDLCRGRAVQVQDAGDEIAHGDSELAPKAAFETAVILRAAKEIAHQLAKYRAAAHELDHACCNGGAQERAAIEAAHDARGKFQFGGKRGLDPSGVFLRAALGER